MPDVKVNKRSDLPELVPGPALRVILGGDDGVLVRIESLWIDLKS